MTLVEDILRQVKEVLSSDKADKVIYVRGKVQAGIRGMFENVVLPEFDHVEERESRVFYIDKECLHAFGKPFKHDLVDGGDGVWEVQKVDEDFGIYRLLCVRKGDGDTNKK